MKPSAESNYTPVEKAAYGKIKGYVKENTLSTGQPEHLYHYTIF